MFKTNISDYQGFQRTVEMVKQELDTENKILLTTCIVEHKVDGNIIPDLNKIVVFSNDNSAKLPTGNIVDGEPEMIGDYDIVELQAESGITSKDMFNGLISLVDPTPLNTKCNYKF